MNARGPNGLESRSAPAAELRTGTGRTLAGYAAVWDTPARIGGRFNEVVRRGAFVDSLASRRDVFMLAQHDWHQPLARLGNGTLQLHEDARGLAFTAQVAETRAGDDILALARSGTIAGCSFSFTIPDGGERWQGREHRELVRLDLHEISAVTQPAYQGTAISARAMARAAGYASACAHIRRLRLLEL